MRITASTLAVIICALCLASGCNQQQKASAPAPVSKPGIKLSSIESLKPSREVGRYQIVFSPHVREDTFLLDTETGRIWQMIQIVDIPNKPTVWQEMTRFKTREEEALFFLSNYKEDKTSKGPYTFGSPPKK